MCPRVPLRRLRHCLATARGLPRADHDDREHRDRHDGEQHRLRLAPDVLEWLLAQPWPGNARELLNVLEGGADHGCRELRMEHLAWTEHLSGVGAPAATTPGDAEVLAALARHGGNRTRAALELALPRTTLIRRLDGLGVPPGRPGRPSQADNLRAIA